jgi:calcineurin-like phosphoesterase family protein
MDSIRQKVVTLASLMRRQSQAEADEIVPEAKTPEGQLRLARYYQIMERLQQETDAVGSDVMITVQDREVSLAQSKVAKDAEAVRPLASGGQEVQFGDGIQGGDWFRWIWSLTDWVDRSEAHPMVRPNAAQADVVRGEVTVALAGDWGTGLYGAPKIASSIRAMAAQRKFDLLLHLGDVYYAGTTDECDQRFVELWPAEAATVNRALNGNHEMYSGGFGYFDHILPKLNQPYSYFAIQNDNWLLAGLDTAYVDHDMDNAQVAWLTSIVNQAKAQQPSRKVVLFSHQQLFSRLDQQGPKLQKALKHLLDDGTITAWYWGHEHECVLYDPHPAWKVAGRCLGNGGIPAVRKDIVKSAPVDAAHPGAGGCTWRRLDATADSPSCLVLDGPNMDMDHAGDQQKFAPHGFMTVAFKGPQLIEKVFLSNGTELFSNTIE